MYRRVGDLGASRRALEDALVRHRQVGNLFAQAVAYSNLGNVTTELGELEEAAHLLERAVDVHEQLGSTSSECLALANLVPTSLLLGRVEAARTYGERAEQLASLDGAPRLVALTRGALGMVAAAEGQADEARTRLSDAAEQLATSGLSGEGAVFLLELALLELGQGELGRATAILDRAEPVLRERTPPSEVARAAIVRARLLHRRRAPGAAEARARAEQLVAALRPHPDSPVAQLLADLHAEVTGPPGAVPG